MVGNPCAATVSTSDVIADDWPKSAVTGTGVGTMRAPAITRQRDPRARRCSLDCGYRESPLRLVGPVLGDPPFDVWLGPDADVPYLPDRPREVVAVRKLTCPLPTDAKPSTDVLRGPQLWNRVTHAPKPSCAPHNSCVRCALHNRSGHGRSSHLPAVASIRTLPQTGVRTVLTTIPEHSRHATPCRPLRPRQRAAVRQALAAAIGDGQATTHQEVSRALFCAPPAEPRPATSADVVVTPDEEVTVPDAAARLGVAQKTVRRYLAPSSGKLSRLGNGISLRSVEALAAVTR